jgi:hypothetical protein
MLLAIKNFMLFLDINFPSLSLGAIPFLIIHLSRPRLKPPLGPVPEPN